MKLDLPNDWRTRQALLWWAARTWWRIVSRETEATARFVWTVLSPSPTAPEIHRAVDQLLDHIIERSERSS